MIISVKNLEKSYFQVVKKFFMFPIYGKVKVIHNISFEIEEGEIVGYLGLNGAGKSTTIKILSGILDYDKGSVEVAGFNPRERKPEFFKQIGVLFGNRTNLIYQLPLIDSFELWRDVYDLNEKDYEEQLAILVDLLNLEELLHTPVRKLSFGQRMRGELASVFLHKPKIVFLDEPTIGVDLEGKQQIYNFLKQINKRDNTTIFMTTHNLQDIEVLCNKILLISKGKIIWKGNLQQLLNISNTKKIVAEIIPTDLSKFTHLCKRYELPRTNNVLELELPSSDVPLFVKRLMSCARVVDISITNPSLEDILSRWKW